VGYRAPNARAVFPANGEEGSGLGLPLMKSKIENIYHGTINFDSQEGKGTTFTVRIPRGVVPADLAMNAIGDAEQADRAMKDAILESYKSFGIDISGSEVDFSRVPLNVPWVMDDRRQPFACKRASVLRAVIHKLHMEIAVERNKLGNKIQLRALNALFRRRCFLQFNLLFSNNLIS